MKIRIIKDIPGYKAGETFNKDENDMLRFSWNGYSMMYPISILINSRYAEEIKDDIDIETIRSKYDHNIRSSAEWALDFTTDDVLFVNAYRIVKEVIDQLNGDWKPDWKDEYQEKFHVYYRKDEKRFAVNEPDVNITILPYCKDKKTAQKVIEICEPELKVLFGVK